MVKTTPYLICWPIPTIDFPYELSLTGVHDAYFNNIPTIITFQLLGHMMGIQIDLIMTDIMTLNLQGTNIHHLHHVFKNQHEQGQLLYQRTLLLISIPINKI